MLDAIIAGYQTLITFLIWIAIAIFFFKSDWTKKPHIIFIVIGFLAIIELVDFYYAQVFIIAWLLLNDIKLMISREAALFLVVIAAALHLFDVIWLELLGLTLYTFILFGFMYYAFEMAVQGEEESGKENEKAAEEESEEEEAGEKKEENAFGEEGKAEEAASGEEKPPEEEEKQE